MIGKDKLSHQQFLKTDKDHRQAASAAHLIYVNDSLPGITRIKKGKRFCYAYNGQIIKDEKMYGSYGLTTLKDEHVTIKKDKLCFSFTGKKGIEHTISLRNKKLARIVKQCRDIPGKELFQYYDAEGNKRHIDSGMVNNYM